VIGENVWKQALNSLPEVLQKQIRTHDSHVEKLATISVSRDVRAQLPLVTQSGKKRLWLSVEVVPGNTPSFLFNKKAFKQLGGILNT